MLFHFFLTFENGKNYFLYFQLIDVQFCYR